MVLAFNRDQFVSAHQISKQENIPYYYLRRILQVLIQNNLAVSKEGNSGGVQLACSPANVRVSDVIQLFQGEIQLSDWMFRKKSVLTDPPAF